MSEHSGNHRPPTLEFEATPPPFMTREECRETHRGLNSITTRLHDTVQELKLEMGQHIATLGVHVNNLLDAHKQQVEGRRAIYRQVGAGIVIAVVGGLLTHFVFKK